MQRCPRGKSNFSGKHIKYDSGCKMPPAYGLATILVDAMAPPASFLLVHSTRLGYEAMSLPEDEGRE